MGKPLNVQFCPRRICPSNPYVRAPSGYLNRFAFGARSTGPTFGNVDKWEDREAFFARPQPSRSKCYRPTISPAPIRNSFFPEPNPDQGPPFSKKAPQSHWKARPNAVLRVRFSSKSGFPRQFFGHSPSRSGLAPPVPDNRPNGPQSARREQIVPIPAIAGASMSIKFLFRSQYRAGPTSDRDEVQDGYG